MKIRRDWKWQHEDLVAQQAGHRENPATVLLIDDLRLTLDAGQTDELTVIQDKDTVFCVSVNRGLGYVGIQGWDKAGAEVVNVFFSGDDLPTSLGPDWDEVNALALLRRASEYL